jgi:hypothetical protein
MTRRLLRLLPAGATVAGRGSHPQGRGAVPQHPNSHKPDRFAQRLGEGDVARIYKRRAADVGLEASEIAGHCSRIGAAQDMLAAGYTGAEIMREVGWRTEKQLFRYTEHLAAQRGAMARFLNRRGSRARPEPAARDDEPSVQGEDGGL